MIPLRVKLRGFMSYRDEQVLSFDGAPLWMLAGPNGAGKSAIFEAITFALYGRTRLGARDHTELITKGKEELLVEVECAVGEDVYLVKRTVARRRTPTRLVYYVSGPHAPDPTRHDLQPIPNTASQQGFDLWVQSVIGLSYETFTATVLLRQGKSEALLEAEASKRHEMLCQIIDVSRYEHLYQVADQRQKEFQSQAKVLGQELVRLEPVSETELADVREQSKTSAANAQSAEDRLLTLAGRKPQAARWSAISRDLEALHQTISDAQALMTQADQIDQDEARLRDLLQVVPQLRDLIGKRHTFAESLRVSQETAAIAEELSAQLDAQRTHRQECEDAVHHMDRQRTDLDQQRSDALAVLADLGPQVKDLETLQQVRDGLARYDQELSEYPADLDAQLQHLNAQGERLDEMDRALPWLQQVSSARKTWHDTQAQLKVATQSLMALREAIPAEVSTQGISTAPDFAATARRNEAQAQTFLEQERKRLNRLHEVEGHPTCDYCGQPLTPAHMAREEQRLTALVLQAEGALTHAQERLQVAEKMLREEQEAQRQSDRAQQEAQQCVEQCRTALEHLPEPYQHRMGLSVPADIASCFSVRYPTEDDLQVMKREVDRRGRLREERDALRSRVSERDQVRAKRSLVDGQRQVLGEQYPEVLAQHITKDYREAQRRQRDAEDALGPLQVAVQEAQQTLAEAAQIEQETEKALRATESTMATESAKQGVLRANVTQLESALPAVWQSTCTQFTDADVLTWQQEIVELTGANTRAEALRTAQRELEHRKQRVDELQNDLAAIPLEARVSVDEIAAQELQAREQSQRVKASAEEVQKRLSELTVRHQRRLDLSTQVKLTERQAYLYKELARLLGREYLQRHVLQQAEARIVMYANRALDRITHGTLRLALRMDAASASNDAAKALELVAYNSEVGEEALLVTALSGSQRFRVAVSLALGIGEFASQGNRRIETVIIDEGFGSLDRQGRQDIIAELQNLTGELRRVILVSHQEEFIAEFRHGYYVELRDQVSWVSDLERQARSLEMPDLLEWPEADVAPTPVIASASGHR